MVCMIKPPPPAVKQSIVLLPSPPPPLPLPLPPGEKLTDDEVDTLLSGVEDSQGQVNYEGTPPKTPPSGGH